MLGRLYDYVSLYYIDAICELVMKCILSAEELFQKHGRIVIGNIDANLATNRESS